MAEANTKKRKREADPCRITYHAPEGRIFERLFKEESLEETKGTVRGKLGLPEHTPIHLTQLREGKVIELEDDDDFESFQILAKCVPSVEVRVTVGDRPRQFSLQNNHTKALLSPDKPEGELSSPGIPRKKRKKKRKDTLRSVLQLPTPSIASEQGQENPFVASPVISHPPVSGAVPSSAQNHADESLDDQPKKKKRKLDPKPTVDEQPTAGPSTPTPATAPEDKAKRKKRSTSKAEKASESVVTTPVPVIPSVKPKSTVVAPGAADEEASRPHKRKRKEKASEEPAPPAVSGVVTPQPADSPSVSKSKKKTKSKRVEENALAVERGVGSAPVPDPSPEESVPATSEDKKKRKRKKQVEEDASQTHVEPIPVFAPTSETLVQTSLTLEETKTKKKSSKKGQEPKSSQISADTFADVTKRIALEVCKDYGMTPLRLLSMMVLTSMKAPLLR
ncbi:hypothetical protein NEOLEDRAFT_76341 [Neolentinus lepideus HHB14362 ss-1]|uniref:Uncharacterized protein n=1 Tax=Neolentinus lepideus HHB14362 ss-1 TaxID=1314782 RepID=A0A165N1Z3_9AGAM|nr:hypothetical protein NEOLEDRAFT_76341 [Neolentinus lepideus HHB14362 ss-1]